VQDLLEARRLISDGAPVSSTALVATVGRARLLRSADGEMPASAQMR